jgi:hypothetical protein
MRVLILAALLLASSSLCPSFAQEQGKPPVEVPQTGAPARTDQNSEQPRDQRTGRDPSRADDRDMGPDWRMRRGDGERMGRDSRETGPAPGMQRDRDWDHGRHGARGDRDGDYADRDRDNRGYFDEDRPRRRVKICVEYENGDEYCRYKR